MRAQQLLQHRRALGGGERAARGGVRLLEGGEGRGVAGVLQRRAHLMWTDGIFARQPTSSGSERRWVGMDMYIVSPGVVANDPSESNDGWLELSRDWNVDLAVDNASDEGFKAAKLIGAL